MDEILKDKLCRVISYDYDKHSLFVTCYKVCSETFNAEDVKLQEKSLNRDVIDILPMSFGVPVVTCADRETY